MVTEEPNLLTAMIASAIFLLAFVAISMHLLNETAAALLGAGTVFMVAYIGGQLDPRLQILSFEKAMAFVDWNVIFLIMGMMIIMAILAGTNVLRWLAFRLYSISKGRTGTLVVSLILLTGVTSAFLNDVTAILFLVPLSIQIGVAQPVSGGQGAPNWHR